MSELGRAIVVFVGAAALAVPVRAQVAPGPRADLAALYTDAALRPLIVPTTGRETYSAVVVFAPTTDVLRRMAEAGLPLDDARKTAEGLQIPLCERDVAWLAQAGIAHRIVRADLEAYYGAVCKQNLRVLAEQPSLLAPAAHSPTNMGYGSMGGFYKDTEVLAVLDNMRARYPNLITARASIGKTLQDRNLWLVKISDNPDIDESEPEAWYDALHHAREPGAYTALLYFMWYLLENYGSDPEATFLVNNRELYFVPMANPDGLAYNETNSPSGGGLWRKNRRPNGGGEYGVDLNRNYPYRWGYDNAGSSPLVYYDTYRGPSAASENETRAITNYVAGPARDIRTLLSVHTYGGYYLYPYGYANVAPEFPEVFQDYTAAMSVSNDYVCGPIYSTLYAANGGSADWALHDRGILAISPEIGTSSFWPGVGSIMPEAAENLGALLITGWAAGGWISISNLWVGDGSLTPGQLETLTGRVFNRGFGGSGDLALTLTSADPNVRIVRGAATVAGPARRATGDNAPAPFLVLVDPAATNGRLVAFTLAAAYGGFTTGRVFETSVVGPDTDGDGLPDYWEQQHFKNATAGVARADSDGDGMLNVDEYRAGTVPTNRDSVLATQFPANPRSATSDGVVVQWPSVTGRLYALERSTNLPEAGFGALATNLPATPPLNTETDTTATGVGPYFYRVRLWP